MLAELGEYLDSKPADAQSVYQTLEYLKHLRQLFEEGFLTHDKIYGPNSPILMGMEQGYKFFCDWLESLLAHGMWDLY